MAAQVFTFNDLKDILIKRVRMPEAQIKNNPALSFEAMGLDSLALVEVQLEVEQRDAGEARVATQRRNDGGEQVFDYGRSLATTGGERFELVAKGHDCPPSRGSHFMRGAAIDALRRLKTSHAKS